MDGRFGLSLAFVWRVRSDASAPTRRIGFTKHNQHARCMMIVWCVTILQDWVFKTQQACMTHHDRLRWVHCDALRNVCRLQSFKMLQIDFGRPNKHFRVHFRTTFQGRKFSIWATKRWKVVRKGTLAFSRKCWFSQHASQSQWTVAPSNLRRSEQKLHKVQNCEFWVVVRVVLLVFRFTFDGCEFLICWSVLLTSCAR